MITLKHMNYSGFDLTRVRMPAGSRYLITAAEADKCIALVCTKGGAYPSDPADTRRYPAAGEPIHYNGTDNADVNMQADVDTEWVCIADNGNGRPHLALASVPGFLNIAAGTGVIVTEGSVTLDGITGGEDAYFKPRAEGTVLIGQGAVILVIP